MNDIGAASSNRARVAKCVKSIPVNEWRCIGMYQTKNSGNKKVLALLSRILAQSCATPPYILFRQGITRTHDCASILDSITKKTSCFHYFSHGATYYGSVQCTCTYSME